MSDSACHVLRLEMIVIVLNDDDDMNTWFVNADSDQGVVNVPEVGLLYNLNVKRRKC